MQVNHNQKQLVSDRHLGLLSGSERLGKALVRIQHEAEVHSRRSLQHRQQLEQRRHGLVVRRHVRQDAGCQATRLQQLVPRQRLLLPDAAVRKRGQSVSTASVFHVGVNLGPGLIAVVIVIVYVQMGMQTQVVEGKPSIVSGWM